MKIELLGALDYNKLKRILKESKVSNAEQLIEQIQQLEVEQRANIVATAGELSRFPGNVFAVLGLRENKSFQQNVNFIKRVIKKGHDSILDHDYAVLALQNVSALVEQTIIEERFASFTVKSRREVDFSTSGFYVPNFHTEDGLISKYNYYIKNEYINHEKELFQTYAQLEANGLSKEDARFVLPYSYYSNIIMGMDARTIKDLIIKLTKTKYSKISELKEFGEQLLKIVQKNMPYLLDEINCYPVQLEDNVEEYLNGFIKDRNYQVISKVKLLNVTPNVDDQILIAAIMKRYQFDLEKARKIYDELCQANPTFKTELMKKISLSQNPLEFTQVSFQYQIPTSFAILTHLTRHRTHDIVVPDFVPTIDLSQYIVPPTMTQETLQIYHEAFQKNQELFWKLKKDYHISENDLPYFTLSGNLVNIITNIDGQTLSHILRLRECNRTQWETRAIANGMHNEIKSIESAKEFCSVLGPTCETQDFCKEGNKCCGKILSILKKKEENNN